MKTTHYDSANEFDPVSYFEGKKVLLVGNSENPKEQDYLKYNSIVRMNLGVQEEPCDVWINNLVYQGHKSLGHIPDVEKIMRMNCEKDGRRLNRYPKELDKYKIWFWNVTDYNNLCNKYSYPRPTTGLVAIYYFLNFVNCDLTITGFDFFKSRNRWTMEIHKHSGTAAYPVHDMEKEERIITDWVKQKRLNAII
jgi:hypothetical protein